MKKIISLILVAILCIGVLAACGGNSGGDTPAPSGSSSATPTSEKQTIKIGIATCFSGNAARSAESQLNGLQVALNEIEAQGLSQYYDFEIVQGDDKFDATEAVQVANKLVYQDDCKVVFGHLAAFVTLAGVGVYEEAHVPCITPTCSSVSLIENGYEYVYLAVPHDKISAYTIIDFLTKDLGMQKIGLLYCDNEQGQAGHVYVNEAMDAAGLELVAEETFSASDTDFTGQMLNFKAAGIDTIMIWGGDSSYRPIMVSQVKQILGNDVLISGDNYFADQSFFDATTAEERAGIYYTAAWSQDFTDDRSVAYVNGYKELDPTAAVVGSVTVRFYDGMYLLVDALNKMGPYDVNAEDFSEKLNTYLKEATAEGLQGTLKPQADGECLDTTFVVKYNESGAQELVNR